MVAAAALCIALYQGACVVVRAGGGVRCAACILRVARACLGTRPRRHTSRLHDLWACHPAMELCNCCNHTYNGRIPWARTCDNTEAASMSLPHDRVALYLEDAGSPCHNALGTTRVPVLVCLLRACVPAWCLFADATRKIWLTVAATAVAVGSFQYLTQSSKGVEAVPEKDCGDDDDEKEAPELIPAGACMAPGPA